MNNGFLYALMVWMLLSGAANKIVSKMQNSTKSDGQRFHHPFFQTFLLFFGEALWMPLYMIYVCIYKPHSKLATDDYAVTVQTASEVGLKTSANPFLFLIPTLIDIVSSTWGFIALNYVEASIFLMLNACGFIWIILFSIIFLKRKLYRHHWTSILFVVVGVTLVGYAGFTDKKGSEKKDTKWIGFVFIFFTQVFGALFYISEEMLFKKYYIHPLKIVGWEGIWGSIIYCGILAALQYIKCEGDLCPQGRLDNTEETYKQLKDNYILIYYIAGLILTHALYNASGVSVTKYANSAQRSTMNSCKTVIVWIFFLSYSGPGHENFLWLQLVGFCILVIGTLIFNEILVIPFWGFNKFTKAALGRETLVSGGGKYLSVLSSSSLDYYPNSPGAHDSSVFDRNVKREYDKKALEYHEKYYN